MRPVTTLHNNVIIQFIFVMWLYETPLSVWYGLYYHLKETYYSKVMMKGK